MPGSGVQLSAQPDATCGDATPPPVQDSSSSSLTSHASTEERVPGVSLGSIALNALADSVMADSVSKDCITTAVPCALSSMIFSPEAETPGGGPSDASMRA